MTDEEILKKMTGMLLDNNKKLLTAVDKSFEKAIEKAIQASEKRIKQELTEKLSTKIDESQKDTIDTLTALMHTGYDLHEKRIQRLEGELNLPPLKPKH
jgi:hypothetical protein